MTFSFARVCCLTIFGALAAPVSATGYDLCGKGGLAFDAAFRETLVGNWTSQHHTGYIRTKETGVMAFPANRPDSVTLWTKDGDIYVSNNNDIRQLALEPYDKKKWQIKRQPWEELPGDKGNHNIEKMERQAVEQGLCQSVNKLPRFTGTIELRQQGIDMTMDVYLTVLHQDRMFGILRASGGVIGKEIDPAAPTETFDFWMWRAFTMTRE